MDELQRQFAYDRLLARAFSGPDADQWVLKGAGALLARLPEARHSRDIDLAYTAGSDIAEAAASLRTAADLNLGDHFRFEIPRESPLQEAASGRRLHVVSPPCLPWLAGTRRSRRGGRGQSPQNLCLPVG